MKTITNRMTQSTTSRRRAFLLTAAAVAACTTTKSSNIKTSGFDVRYEVTSQGNDAPVARATFYVANSVTSYIELSDGDTITCDGQGLDKVKIGGTWYSKSVAAGIPNHVFELRRPDEPPYQTTVPTPPDFKLTNAQLDGKYDASFTLTWNNSGNNQSMEISSTGGTSAVAGQNCRNPTFPSATDVNGTYVIHGSDLKPVDGSTPTCTYSIQVTRVAASTPAPAPFSSLRVRSAHTETTSLYVHP